MVFRWWAVGPTAHARHCSTGALGRLVDPRNQHELVQAITAALENGSSRRRIDAIETFNTQNFRARVADWCRAQVTPAPRERRARNEAVAHYSVDGSLARWH